MDRLDYRPEIQHIPDKHDAIPLTPEHQGVVEEELYYILTTAYVWDTLSRTITEIDQLMDTINQRMGEITTQIQDHAIWDILERMKEEYGDQSPEGHMSFDLYKAIFSNDDYQSYILKQSYESEHMSLDGMVEVELYPVLKQVQQEAAHTSKFAKDTIFNLIDKNITGDIEDSAVSNQIETVIAEYERGRHQLVKHLQEESNQGDAVATERLQYELDQDRTRYELKDLVNGRTAFIQSSVDNISHILEHRGNMHHSRAKLIQGVATAPNIQDQIHYINKLCEFICSQKSAECLKQKEHLEGTDIPRNATDGILTAMAHYKQKISSPTVSWMMHLGEPLDAGGAEATEETYKPIEEIADVLSEGIEYNIDEYRRNIMGSYGLARSCMKTRQAYNQALQDKEKVRAIYQITNRVADKLQESRSHTSYLAWVESVGRGES